ncbi:MAG: acyl-CoA dehydrogenase family protein [Microthrixaceae bacterium]
MDFTLDDTETAIAELAAQIIGDASSHEQLRALERSGEPRFDRDLWASLAETGVLGAFVPTGHGGAGLGLVALAATLEAAGRNAAAVPLLVTLAMGVLPMAEFAPGPLAAEVLPAVAAGEMVLTAAWHEDQGDCLAPAVIATRGGDSFMLTGTKICVPAGMVADAVIVPAALEDNGSVGLFLVRTDAEGVAREPLASTFGDPQAALLLAEAPAELVGEGRSCLEFSYQRAVAAQCSLAAGVCAGDLELTAAYTKERKQFDVALATFQAVAHRAADAYIDTEAVQITSRAAMWRLQESMEASKEVDVAKYWAASAGHRIVHTGQHLHGGTGVDRDYPLHRYFFLAKELELQLGGASEHLRDLGRRLAHTAS